MTKELVTKSPELSTLFDQLTKVTDSTSNNLNQTLSARIAAKSESIDLPNKWSNITFDLVDCVPFLGIVTNLRADQVRKQISQELTQSFTQEEVLQVINEQDIKVRDEVGKLGIMVNNELNRWQKLLWEKKEQIKELTSKVEQSNQALVELRKQNDNLKQSYQATTNQLQNSLQEQSNLLESNDDVATRDLASIQTKYANLEQNAHNQEEKIRELILLVNHLENCKTVASLEAKRFLTLWQQTGLDLQNLKIDYSQLQINFAELKKQHQRENIKFTTAEYETQQAEQEIARIQQERQDWEIKATNGQIKINNLTNQVAHLQTTNQILIRRQKVGFLLKGVKWTTWLFMPSDKHKLFEASLDSAELWPNLQNIDAWSYELVWLGFGVSLIYLGQWLLRRKNNKALVT